MVSTEELSSNPQPIYISARELLINPRTYVRVPKSTGNQKRTFYKTKTRNVNKENKERPTKADKSLFVIGDEKDYNKYMGYLHKKQNDKSRNEARAIKYE